MKNASIVIGIMALILGVGYVVTNDTTNDVTTAAATSDSASEAASETAVVTSEEVSLTATQTDTEPAAAESDSADAADTSGVFAAYDAAAIAESEAEHILLFFHATWCPSCRALENDIKENADSIPGDVAIYKVDYDTATALKRQYGVTTQHSIIEIAADGTAESSISHGLTLDDVLATL